MDCYRIALLSDIHGHELALRSVLDDIHAHGVDEIACLGDCATLGPEPGRVLEMLREHCSVFILGNHDEYLTRPELISAHTEAPPVVEAIHWCRSQIDAEAERFVASFVARHELSLGEAGKLLLYHGSPESNICDLLSHTPELELEAQLGATRAPLMAGGHTHLQMLRQHRGVWVINPGSVGLPFERYVSGAEPNIMPHAEYALVEARGRDVAVTLKRVALDRDELVKRARAWDQPLSLSLLRSYEN